MAQKVFAAATASLQETGSQLDPALLTTTAAMIEQADEVAVFGVGTSAYVALDAMRRLMRIGIRVSVETSGVDQAVRAALLGPSSVVLAVSTTGESTDVLSAARIAAGRGARLIVITHAGRSSLGRSADLLLTIAAQESAFGTEALAARLATLALLDSLFVLLAIRRNATAVANLDRITAALGPGRT